MRRGRLNTLPGREEIELLLVAPRQSGAVTGRVVRLAAPGAGRGLQALTAALLADTGVLTHQGPCRLGPQAGAGEQEEEQGGHDDGCD